MKSPRTSRSKPVRLIAFFLLALFLAYILTNASLGMAYAFFLTHPGCPGAPAERAGNRAPQKIGLQTVDNLSVNAWYYPAVNSTAVIVLGGLDGALGDRLPPVDFLIEAGYGILQIDTRACASPPAAVTLGGNEVHEVDAAVDFLLSHPEVREVAVFGYSMGAAAAIRAARGRPEIRAVVAEGGFFNLADDMTEPGERKTPWLAVLLHTIAFSFWLQSGANPWQISPIDDLPLLSPRPVLLIYGELEAASGRAEDQFAAALEPKELWIVPGGSHGKNYLVQPEEYRKRVLDFFDQHLGEE